MSEDQAQRAVRRVEDHPATEALARLGFVSYGLVHILVAGLALLVAWSKSDEDASSSGALKVVAGSPGGFIALIVAAVGLAALVLWQAMSAILEAMYGDLTDHWKRFFVHLGRAIVYGALTALTVRTLLNRNKDSSKQTASFTAKVMELPLGQILVGAAGLAVLIFAGYNIYKGISKTFLKELGEHPGTVATRLGQIGFVTKGLGFLVVGGLIIVSAVQFDPEKSRGLDGALRALVEQPFGPYLLTLVALGLICYGLYCFARARHADL